MTKDDLKIFKNPPILKTERLTLRKIEKSDLNDIYEYAEDPKVSEYLLWSPHTDKSYTSLYLKLVLSKYKKCEFYDWGIEYNGKMIGTCGFTAFDLNNNSAEIGYVLNSEYWHLGIAKEAAECILEFGFNKLFLYRIEAKFMPKNTESRKVAEKIGMKYEGAHKGLLFAKGRYIDVGVCAITVEEYRNK